MKKTSLALLCLSLLALAAPAPAQPTPAAPVPNQEAVAAITRLRDGLLTSFNKGDLDALTALLDPEVVVTWQSNEVCRGPEAVKAFYAKQLSGPNKLVAHVQTNPEITGRTFGEGWALAWGNLHDTAEMAEGTKLPFESAFTATIAKRGDKWLVTSFHASVDAFQDPLALTAVQKIARFIGIASFIAGIVFGIVAVKVLFTKKEQPAKLT